MHFAGKSRLSRPRPLRRRVFLMQFAGHLFFLVRPCPSSRTGTITGSSEPSAASTPWPRRYDPREFDPPPLKTIAAWRQRNSVPGLWAPLLIDLAIRKGLLKQVSDLLVF